MDASDYGHLAYLGLLGAVLVFWYLIQNRQSLGKTVQQAAAWALIFLGAIAVIGLWDDIRNTVRPGQADFVGEGRIEVPRAMDGHYYLELFVNDAPVRFVIDTGATGVVLTRKDAAQAGLDPDGLRFSDSANTANGVVRTAPVTLNRVTLGPVVDRDVAAWVNDGDMNGSLLGMTYLQRWSRIEIGDGKLILHR